MRTTRRALRLACYASVTLFLSSTCAMDGSRDLCADADVELSTSVGMVGEAGSLPEWAVGAFGVHAIDIHNLDIAESGDVTYAMHGGDYGGCGTLTAHVADDRVVLVDPHDTEPEPHSILSQGDDGDVYWHRIHVDDRCNWYRMERSALCGRDVGGCGGFGSAEPCPWTEGGCEPFDG